MSATITDGPARSTAMTRKDAMVIGASALGTVFEWYDFYLYGALALFITAHFFSGVNETTGFILALLAFAAGFAVRPLGALVFGRMGDLWGRKNTFLVTMALMGLSTFAVGLLPSYEQIGVAAPLALVFLRLIQGLALGGEYGGAATYVAEHAPPGRRGFYTSWIQTTATLGLFASLLVILGTRNLMGEEAFRAWGWRVPFLLSIILLAISIWIRLKLQESPTFRKMKAEGRGSDAPITESFGRWSNLKVVLIALFGLTAGQAVVWYSGQFYALFFLEKTLKVDGETTNLLIAAALLLATPFFVIFGWLSDKVGRKPIILTGCLLAALTYFPLFHALAGAANPALARAAYVAPVIVYADPADCSFQFDPVGKSRFSTSCDLAKTLLAQTGIPYSNEAAAPASIAMIQIGAMQIESFRGERLESAVFQKRKTAWEAEVRAALATAGYPERADPAAINKPRVVGILFLLVLYVTMVYGPIAAALVELFPTRIRYTAMSLPYHIGNGWLGGFLPTTAFAVVAATGNIYAGLWYPVIIAALTVIIGLIFLKDRKDVALDEI
ncbi:MAG TPA: MFS transporter [Pelagibacterium sp.]|uniref:MFS transporter n=1 Tax=Pelagibacterium sp. TaxID=1967288 RepID=UPI002C3A4AF8|nr:MFS transporter [Pelagibacterium sp.]HWJ86807.1 MFS transporter [Pelagibacterium sp.]